MAINGTANDDILAGTIANDTINGFAGDDSLSGLDGKDTLNGGDDNDTLDGGLGNDTLNGDAGDDTITGGLTDTIDGGTGIDHLNINISTLTNNITMSFDFTAAVVNSLPNGTQFTNIETIALTTGTGNDRLTLDETAIYGASLNSSSWTAGLGTDKATIDWTLVASAVTLTDGGISTLSSSFTFSGVEEFIVTTGNGTDNLSGGTGADVLTAGGNVDTLTGGTGKDDLFGGDGNDTINAGTAFDLSDIDNAFGGSGDDIISAAFKDVIDGGSGRDVLNLDLSDRSADIDYVFAPNVATVIESTSFDHIEQLNLTTGSGDDTVLFDSSSILSAPGTANKHSWNGGLGSDRATVDFSDLTDSFTATPSVVTVGTFKIGFGGDVETFRFFGGSGFDTLTGGIGNDLLMGNEGRDTLNGGDGNDNLQGGGNRDTLNGGFGLDTMTGGLDRDTLNGGDGNDTMSGEAGNDTLNGNIDKDTMDGGDGNDTLNGGANEDEMTGGLGNDLFIFSVVGDSTGKFYDQIVGFDFNNVDHMRFGGAVPTGFDGKVGSGDLDLADFNDDLEAAITAAKLLADHCVLFTPTTGTLAGTTFAIVDVNNVAGYQASADYVVELVTPANLNKADLLDFTG